MGAVVWACDVGGGVVDGPLLCVRAFRGVCALVLWRLMGSPGAALGAVTPVAGAADLWPNAGAVGQRAPQRCCVDCVVLQCARGHRWLSRVQSGSAAHLAPAFQAHVWSAGPRPFGGLSHCDFVSLRLPRSPTGPHVVPFDGTIALMELPHRISDKLSGIGSDAKSKLNHLNLYSGLETCTYHVKVQVCRPWLCHK